MLGQIQAPVRALAAVLDLASELTYCVYDKNAPREMADKRVSVIGVCLSVCLSAVWCADPGNTAYAERQNVVGQTHPQSGLFTFESQLVYVCQGGRRFEDGLTSRLVLCDVHADWNDTVFTCECM